MHMDEKTYAELIDYLARRPWFEVNKLLAKLAQPKKPEVEAPAALKETQNGN